VTSCEPFFDPELRTFNWAHVDRGLVSPCGTMQAAGASLDWQRDQLALIEAIQAEAQGCKVQDLIDLEVRQSPPGANGLLFLPYLLGERSPYWNPAAKGSLLGLNKKHTRADIFRACIEGVVLNLKIIWNSMQPVVDSEELVLTGGQASSDVNKQIVADMLGIPVVSHDHLRDSKNFGAAMIGGVGIGMFDQVSDVRSLLKMEQAIQPNLENTAFYNRILPIFADSYHALESICGRLDQVTWNE
jgi:xylulokinase